MLIWVLDDVVIEFGPMALLVSVESFRLRLYSCEWWFFVMYGSCWAKEDGRVLGYWVGMVGIRIYILLTLDWTSLSSMSTINFLSPRYYIMPCWVIENRLIILYDSTNSPNWSNIIFSNSFGTSRSRSNFAEFSLLSFTIGLTYQIFICSSTFKYLSQCFIQHHLCGLLSLWVKSSTVRATWDFPTLSSLYTASLGYELSILDPLLPNTLTSSSGPLITCLNSFSCATSTTLLWFEHFYRFFISFFNLTNL